MSDMYWKIQAKPAPDLDQLKQKLLEPLKPTGKQCLSAPILKPLPNGKWEVVEDWYCEYCGHAIIVNKGFITDGASVPRILWPVFGSPMKYPYPYSGTLHDYLYYIGYKLDPNPNSKYRKYADQAFRDYNIQLGMNKVKAYTEYYVLRAFGGSSWCEGE